MVKIPCESLKGHSRRQQDGRRQQERSGIRRRCASRPACLAGSSARGTFSGRVCTHDGDTKYEHLPIYRVPACGVRAGRGPGREKIADSLGISSGKLIHRTGAGSARVAATSARPRRTRSPGRSRRGNREYRELRSQLFAGALGTGSLLRAVNKNFELVFAFLAGIFVDGHRFAPYFNLNFYLI